VPPSPRWGVGSRGVWLTCELDPANGTPGDFAVRPRRYDVLDCSFRRITSSRFQRVPGRGNVPIDADGVHIGALYSEAGVVLPHRAATGVVRGSTFEQCEFRCVKLQIGHAIVTQNTFVRTTHGQCDVDAQFAGAHVTDNTFSVQRQVHLQGAGLIQGAVRGPGGEEFVITHNRVEALADVNTWAPFGLASTGPDLSNVIIADNTVVGVTGSFLFVWQPPAAGNHAPTVVRNTITGFTNSFATVGGAAPGTMLRGTWVQNRAELPGVQTTVGFAPQCWVANKGIAHRQVL
jgi:hypothetical protein